MVTRLWSVLFLTTLLFILLFCSALLPLLQHALIPVSTADSGAIHTGSIPTESPLQPESTTPHPLVDSFSWSNVSSASLQYLLSPLEWRSIPYNASRNGTCRGSQIEPACCLGTISQNSGNRLYRGACYASVPAQKSLYVQRFPVPFGREFRVSDQRLYDMGDVLRALGNRSLFFLGDSVMHQNWDAALCDVGRRTGRSIKVRNFKRERLWSQVGAMQRFVAEVEGMPAKLLFHREYRPSTNGLTMKEVCKQADVLIFNYGLHWGNPYAYLTDMRTLSRWLKAYCRHVTLIFRGSSTQHFFSETGIATKNRQQIVREVLREIGPSAAHEVTQSHRIRHMGCKPRRVRPRNTRDDVAKEAFAKEDITVVDVGSVGMKDVQSTARRSNGLVVYFIPFGEITAPLYDFHYLECTHFCYSPLLWAPVSHYVYKVIGQAFGKAEASKLRDPKPWIRTFEAGPDYAINELMLEGNGVYKAVTKSPTS